jgi:hypothetical protein
MSEILGKDALIERLTTLRGAAFCSVITVTNPKQSGMRMTSREGGERNPFVTGAGKSAVWHLRKIGRTLVLLNGNYLNGVRRQMEREGLDPDTWVPGKTWYTQDKRDDGTTLPFATGTNNGKSYLCGRRLKTIADAQYVDIRDGTIVAAEDVEPFMPPAEARYGKQKRAGLEKTINRQVWGLETIRAINVNGKHFEIHPLAVNADHGEVHRIVTEMIVEYGNEHNDAEDVVKAEDAEVAEN